MDDIERQAVEQIVTQTSGSRLRRLVGMGRTDDADVGVLGSIGFVLAGTIFRIGYEKRSPRSYLNHKKDDQSFIVRHYIDLV